MNDGFFLTNFNGLQINKKTEKDIITEIKPINSVANKEDKKKKKEIVIKKESLNEVKIKKVINKEIKTKLKTRNSSTKQSEKTKSKCIQPIIIENILFHNEKSMNDVEEEFKSQNRMLVSQNDELNSSINIKKKRLESLDSQISTVKIQLLSYYSTMKSLFRRMYLNSLKRKKKELIMI
jgi:hypothetical protein